MTPTGPLELIAFPVAVSKHSLENEAQFCAGPHFRGFCISFKSVLYWSSVNSLQCLYLYGKNKS